MGEMRAVVRPGIEPSDLLIIHAAELGTCRAPAAGGMPEKGPGGAGTPAGYGSWLCRDY